jgi:hypothetical protein
MSVEAGNPAGRNMFWRAGLVVTTAFALGLTACGTEKDSPDPNHIDTPSGELATGNADGELAAGELDEDTTDDTLATLDRLADHSPLDDLVPFEDRLEDQDPNMVGNTFLARLGKFYETNDPTHLEGFGEIATELAQSVNDNENPVTITPSDDAQWEWYQDPITEKPTAVLTSGSIDITYGEADHPYANEIYTLGTGGLMVILDWTEDGYFGRHQTYPEGDNYFQVTSGEYPLDQAAEPAEETASTTEAPTTTVEIAPPPETEADYPPEIDQGPAPAEGEFRTDNTGFMWKWENGQWLPLGMGGM